jgi:hypothetical protein
MLRLRKVQFLLALLTALLPLVATLHAQSVRFLINEAEVTTDEAIVLYVEVSGLKGGSIRTPNFPEVKGLQRAGTSNSQSWVNGVGSVTFSQNYVTGNPGTYKIPSFTYVLGNQTLNSPDYTIKVKKGTGKKQQGGQNPGGNPFANPFDDFFRDPFSARPKEQLKFQETKADYFLSINLDKDSCYVGEQVFGEVVLYINERDYGKIGVDAVDIVDMQQRIKNTGFWQEIIEFEQIPMQRVQLNGKTYIAYTLYKTVLFPIRAGKVEFKNIDLNAKKLYVATNASPLDALMGNNTKYEPIRIAAHERKLTVRPLPPTKLPDVSMVGKFKLEAALTQSQANTGDNVELRVKVSGNGNMAMMNPPIVNFPPSFRQDGNSSDYNTKLSENGYYGEKLFKFFLVPTKPGSYNLGPVKFYFFDQNKRAFDSLVVADIPLQASGEDLANKLLKNSGMDGFYERNIAAADTDLDSDSNTPKWLWFVGFFALIGAVAVKLVRERRAAPLGKKDPFLD